MLRNRRRLVAVASALFVALALAVPAQAFAANVLDTYWVRAHSGPLDIPNPNPALDPIPVSAYARAVDAADATHIWAVGYWSSPAPVAPLVQSTADGGTWNETTLTAYPGSTLRGVAAVDATHVWAVGDGGLILQRGFSDASWSRQASGTVNVQLNAVAFADANTGWAVGGSGTVLATTNGGATWSVVAGLPAVSYYGVTAIDATHVWIVGAAGVVVYNTGAGWKTASAVGTLRSVSFADASHGWAVGDGRSFNVTADGGQTWTTQAALAPIGDVLASPKAVSFSSALRGIAVGDHETWWRTWDGGVTWEVNQDLGTAGVGSAVNLAGMAADTADAATVWAVGSGDPVWGVLVPKAMVFKGQMFFPYAITPTAGAHGTISPSTTQAVAGGGSATFTFAPDTGYHVADVLVDGVSVGDPASYTFTNVTADHTISVRFAINTYTLTPSAGANGTISPATAQTVDWGGGKTFTITPAAHYHVADVLVDGASQGAITSYTFMNVTANHTISASFAIDTYEITPSAGPGGSISPATLQAVGWGSTPSFTITPDTGYHVVDVVVDSVSQGPVTSYTFTSVAANHTISATFAINTYTIAPSSGANGSISPNTTQTVPYGGGTTFTIAPSAGYHIVDVSVDASSVGDVSAYSFTNVTADHTISATFAQTVYDITVTPAVSNGTIIGPAKVAAGSDAAFTITPNTGYHVTNVIVDGTSLGVRTSHTFTNVQAAHTISATFAINTYTVTSSAGANGSISPRGALTVNYGTSPSFNITPSQGYHVADLVVDGASVSPSTSYTFSNVTANHTISATFAINTYTITPAAGADGSITPGTPQTVSYGESATFAIRGNTGYHIVDVLVDGVSKTATETYTFANVTANHTISATFAQTMYDITALPTSNGGITGPPRVAEGSDATFTITPDPGYHVEDVLVDGISKGAMPEYGFKNVHANATISATFALDIVPTTITFKAAATSTTIGGRVVLSGWVTPMSMIGKNVVVWVKKPGKSYYSYSSNRTVYSLSGGAAWWYRYYFKPGMTKGVYYFKSSCPAPGFGYTGFTTSTSPVVAVRLR